MCLCKEAFTQSYDTVKEKRTKKSTMGIQSVVRMVIREFFQSWLTIFGGSLSPHFRRRERTEVQNRNFQRYTLNQVEDDAEQSNKSLEDAGAAWISERSLSAFSELLRGLFEDSPEFKELMLEIVCVSQLLPDT